jgi:hypothetical protein
MPDTAPYKVTVTRKGRKSPEVDLPFRDLEAAEAFVKQVETEFGKGEYTIDFIGRREPARAPAREPARTPTRPTGPRIRQIIAYKSPWGNPQ